MRVPAGLLRGAPGDAGDRDRPRAPRRACPQRADRPHRRGSRQGRPGLGGMAGGAPLLIPSRRHVTSVGLASGRAFGVCGSANGLTRSLGGAASATVESTLPSNETDAWPSDSERQRRWSVNGTSGLVFATLHAACPGIPAADDMGGQLRVDSTRVRVHLYPADAQGANKARSE